MGKIQIMPEALANKIAAGEVVERPASAVKELVENALDAGATRIAIEVESGGRRRIQVTDDGHGMRHDDAMLAFEQHATSKLLEARDLDAVATLGFRGEALPAIASVSRVLLETREADSPTGTKLELAGGRLLSVSESGLPRGTRIEVRDLFFNVPARKKFLRSEKTELSHIASMATHYSLAYRDKYFSLRHERGDLLNVGPTSTLRERVYQVFGGETLEQLVELSPVERTLDVTEWPTWAEKKKGALPTVAKRVFRLHGFVSTPQVQKSNRNSIYVFINGRLIRDRIVLRALSSAYYNLIPPGSFPFVLLFLDIPYAEVDVNVHPSKLEVRFRHQNFLHDLVRDVVREQLVESKPVSSLPLPRESPQPSTQIPYSENTQRLESDPAVEAAAFALRPVLGETRTLDLRDPGPPPPEPELMPIPAPEEPTHAESVDALPPEPPSASHTRAPLVDDEATRTSMGDLSRLQPVGQLKDSFILATAPDGMWIIDQHVAHERILFEQVLRQRLNGGVPSQRLLVPAIVTLRPGQELLFAELEEELRSNGFEIEPFGHRTVAVKAAPAELRAGEVEALLADILDAPAKDYRSLSVSDLRRRVSATVACHAAIKVNMRLEPEKIRWLLDELARCDYPMSCPHGRPVALKYDLKDILKAFHRL